ncbi:phosphoglycerate mutase family protein [Besnoitia besnoiti]|uniref:Phosphoglycerate mutase family protein n=1 Tax=Besnoitia besnoiti TaxID=94643 RepID=A0A2A9M468_BESBE|nr:phosphoglycerate mutase family protein [Besnoitia besnoiti]PFH31101.1 phosphoglycerate mutase family protein [Besnoitia besnoiti]
MRRSCPVRTPQLRTASPSTLQHLGRVSTRKRAFQRLFPAQLSFFLLFALFSCDRTSFAACRVSPAEFAQFSQEGPNSLGVPLPHTQPPLPPPALVQTADGIQSVHSGITLSPYIFGASSEEPPPPGDSGAPDFRAGDGSFETRVSDAFSSLSAGSVSPLSPGGSFAADASTSSPAGTEMLSLVRSGCVGPRCSRVVAFVSAANAHALPHGPRDFRVPVRHKALPRGAAQPFVSSPGLAPVLAAAAQAPPVHSGLLTVTAAAAAPALLPSFLSVRAFASPPEEKRSAGLAQPGGTQELLALSPHRGGGAASLLEDSCQDGVRSDALDGLERSSDALAREAVELSAMQTGQGGKGMPAEETAGRRRPSQTSEADSRRPRLPRALRAVSNSVRGVVSSAVGTLRRLSGFGLLRRGRSLWSQLRARWPRSRRERSPSQMAELIGTWLDKNEQDVRKGKKKLLLLVRHAESAFNQWRRESFSAFRVRDMLTYDPNMPDVCLTSRGLQQCQKASDFYRDTCRALPSLKVDLFVVSPLMRTVQTALNIFSCPPRSEDNERKISLSSGETLSGAVGAVEHPLQSAHKFLLFPLLRERTDTTGDTGRDPEALRIHLETLRAEGQIPQSCDVDEALDWSLMYPGNKWWLQFTDDEAAAAQHIVNQPWYEGTDDPTQKSSVLEHVEDGEGAADPLSVSLTDRKKTGEIRAGRFEGESDKTRLEGEPKSVRQKVVEALKSSYTEVADCQREEAWRRRLQASWRFRKVPLENKQHVLIRSQLGLKALCSVKEAKVVVMVGHSVTFRILTSSPKMGNASIVPFVLNCQDKTVTELVE